MRLADRLTKLERAMKAQDPNLRLVVVEPGEDPADAERRARENYGDQTQIRLAVLVRAADGKRAASSPTCAQRIRIQMKNRG